MASIIFIHFYSESFDLMHAVDYFVFFINFETQQENEVKFLESWKLLSNEVIKVLMMAIW